MTTHYYWRDDNGTVRYVCTLQLALPIREFSWASRPFIWHHQQLRCRPVTIAVGNMAARGDISKYQKLFTTFEGYN
jgi:hypothetical protein